MATRVDLPAAKPTRDVYHWFEIADELRANQGEWFEIAVMPYSGYVTYLNQGRVAAFKEGRWEFTSRTARKPDGSRTWTVYGKYVGP